jgi:hypothetical protein
MVEEEEGSACKEDEAAAGRLVAAGMVTVWVGGPKATVSLQQT